MHQHCEIFKYGDDLAFSKKKKKKRRKHLGPKFDIFSIVTVAFRLWPVIKKIIILKVLVPVKTMKKTPNFRY